MATTRVEVSETIDLSPEEATDGLETARRLLVREVLGDGFKIGVRSLRKIATRRGLLPAMLDVAFRGEGPTDGVHGHAWVWFDDDAAAAAGQDGPRRAYIKLEWRTDDPRGRAPDWLRDTLEGCLREAFVTVRPAPAV